jgi:drug/metabolite transporter (DMT)-like permease
LVKPPLWIYAFLSCFDLFATAVGGVGLLWVDASTNQMLRGSMVVFAAIFTYFLLKRSLTPLQIGGVSIVALGLVLVGLSGLLRPKDSSDDDTASTSQMILGIGLVLIGSMSNAIQNVLEEKLMKGAGGDNVDPLEIVGWEGVFGCLSSSFLLLPICQHIPGPQCGSAEDTLDTFVQMGNNPLIIVLCLAYVFSLCAMNFTSMQISKVLSAIHRNLVNACRTVSVWVVSILLYYVFTSGSFGEAWDNWSLIQLGGFFLLLGGTLVYSYGGMKKAAQSVGLDSSSDELITEEVIVPEAHIVAIAGAVAADPYSQGHTGSYQQSQSRSHHRGQGYQAS